MCDREFGCGEITTHSCVGLLERPFRWCPFWRDFGLLSRRRKRRKRKKERKKDALEEEKGHTLVKDRESPFGLFAINAFSPTLMKALNSVTFLPFLRKESIRHVLTLWRNLTGRPFCQLVSLCGGNDLLRDAVLLRESLDPILRLLRPVKRKGQI